tara:strand:+ start:7868 stop:10477 length:2610 start_codon:yes stop_codon:yes gene_type:complete
MLELYEVGDEKQKLDFFQSYKPSEDIWLVSTMNDKREWQAEIFKSQTIVLDNHLLRISEFWQNLYRYIGRDYKYVSNDYFKIWLQENFRFSIEFKDHFLIQFLKHLQDYLFEAGQFDFLQEWLQNNLEDADEVERVLSVLHEIIEKIQNDKIVCDYYLVKIIDQNLDTILEKWNFSGKIFVDIEFDLLPIEAKILQRIAKEHCVNILLPTLGEKAFLPYEYQRFLPLVADTSLLKKTKVFEAKEQAIGDYLVRQPYQYYAANSLSEEVFYVLGEIRSLLEQGLNKSDIRILAADKNRYEFLLQYLLYKEGINSSFIMDEPISAYSHAQKIAGMLRVLIEEREPVDLILPVANETTNYQKLENYSNENLDYSWLKEIPEWKDLVNGQQRIDCWELLGLIESRLGLDESTDSLFAMLLNDFSETEKLPLKTWYNYFDSVSRKLYSAKQNFIEGDLRVTNLAEGAKYSQKHIFILGFNDEDLKYRVPTLLENLDLLKITQDLGFWFENPFSKKNYYKALKLIHDPDKQVYLSFSRADMQNNALSPSFLHYNLKVTGQLKQTHSLGKLTSTIEVAEANANIPSYKLEKISASSFERYVKCPFIYAAEKVFGLESSKPLSVRLGPLEKGSLFHTCLEELLSKQILQPSEENLRQIVQAKYKELDIKILNPKFRHIYLEETCRQLQRFLTAERNWRQEHPDIQTMACEFKMDGFLSYDAKFSKTAGDIHFTGSIDRMDEDQGQRIILIDYKSGTSYKNANSWLKEGSIQLAIYSLFVQDVMKKNVVGGIYFSLKSLDRETGFMQLALDNSLSPSKSRKSFYISEQEQQDILDQVRGVLKQSLEGIQRGEFMPKPLKEDFCDKCNWRDLCRAPHLY